MDNDNSERVAENMMGLVRTFFLLRRGIFGVKPLPHDPAYWVLGLLTREELSISDIGRRLSRSKPSMTLLISKLITEGKAQRLPDKSDRRVIRIAITPKGRKFLASKREEVKARVKEGLSRLSRKDIGRLCSSLEEVNPILERLVRE